MPDPKPTAPAQFPNVDRLVDLASDKENKGSKNPKDSAEKSMWKLLLQLRPFLPYLARLVPILDVAVGPLQSAGVASDVRKTVAESVAESTARLQSTLQSGLQSIQGDVSTVATNLEQQSAQLKRLEDELTRLRTASEKAAVAQASLSEELGSIKRFLQTAVLGGAILLVALVVLSVILLIRLPH